MNEIPRRARSLETATGPTAKNSRRKASSRLRGTPYLIFSIAAMCALHSANASSQTWTGATSGAWSTPTNWAGGAAPGATSGVTSTDYAIFNTAVSNTTVTIDTYLNLSGFTFTGAPGSYTIGSTSGSSVYLTAGGTSQITTGLTNTSTVIETINAPLIMQGGYTLYSSGANGTGVGSATFVIGGSITTAASSGTSSLNLRGSNTSANTISGTISDGTRAALTVSKMDSGTWVFSGTNTYTGKTSVLVGTLSINTIADSGVGSAIGAGSMIAFGQNTLTSNTGTLLYTGTTTSSNRAIAITNGSNGVAGGIINVNSAATTLTLSGSVSTASNAYASTLALAGSGNGVLSGNILNVGTLSFVKNGTGTWTLSGSNGSTGAITVNAGTLQIGNGGTTGGIDSISAVSGSNGATLAFFRSDAISYGGVISGSLAVKQIGTGSLIFTGANTYTGLTTIGSGTLQLGNGGTTGSLATTGTIVNNGSLVINRSNSVTQGTDFSSTAISGNGSLTQAGSGTTTLNKANSYTGLTTVSAGELDFNNTTGNAITGHLLVNGGVAKLLAANQISSGKNLTVTSGTFDLQNYNQSVANVQLTGGVIQGSGTLSSSNAYDVQSGTISANLAGTGGLNKTTSDNATLSGSNTYTGATAVTGGTLTLDGLIAASSAVSVNNATLAGSGTASGTVSSNNATIHGNALRLGATTLYGTSTLSGYNIASSVTVNSGTTTLTGTTQSTSALFVSAEATLNANGTISGNANVSGLLKGKSTVTGNLALISGTLAPGNSAGITTVEGDFTVDRNSTLVAEVSGNVAGTTYDQIKVSGNVSIAGTLNLSDLSGLTLGSTITLIDNAGSGTTTGYFSTIITSGSTYSVTSNSDYTFTVGSTEYLLSYNTSSSASGANFNDVTLTVVPEPGSWAMLISGIGMLAFGQRLRRRAA